MRESASRTRLAHANFNPARLLAIGRRFWQYRVRAPNHCCRRLIPKLLDRVRWHLRVKHYSIRTEQAYIDWRVNAVDTR